MLREVPYPGSMHNILGGGRAHEGPQGLPKPGGVREAHKVGTAVGTECKGVASCPINNCSTKACRRAPVCQATAGLWGPRALGRTSQARSLQVRKRGTAAEPKKISRGGAPSWGMLWTVGSLRTLS